MATPVDLRRWPVLQGYASQLRERPSVARALGIERELYARQYARSV